MEIKVRDLGHKEEKSKAEIEEELLKKHEEKFEDSESKPQNEQTETTKVSTVEEKGRRKGRRKSRRKS